MAQFNKANFISVINEIENMEQNDENIWVPIGVLEYMYNDHIGYIDRYFLNKDKRNVDELWDNLWNNIEHNPGDFIYNQKREDFIYGREQIRQLEKKFDKEKIL